MITNIADKIDLNSNLYQSVYVTLQDGRVGMFSGPAFINNGDVVENIAFTQHMAMPDNCTWQDLCNQKIETVYASAKTKTNT